MTRADFLKRFPRASEDTLRWNCPGEPANSPASFVDQLLAKAKAKPSRRRLVPRTRNLGTMTEAAYWGHLRSCLRRGFRFWKPALAALHAARTPCAGPRGQKWAYLCAGCGKLHLRKNVQIDHIKAVGSLLTLGDLAAFVERLTPEEPGAFQILCTTCHLAKTAREAKP